MDTFGLGLALAFICVGVHYEGLSLGTSVIRRLPITHRARVVVGLITALFAHILEVMIFAAGWYVLNTLELAKFSLDSPTPVDLIYFSFVTYTSLGYGDIVPLGNVRVIAGLEALLGLVLIAWTASFTYFEMTLYWDENHPIDQLHPQRRYHRAGSPSNPRSPHDPAEG